MWVSKRCRRLEAERDEANTALRLMLDENTELAKRLREAEEELERTLKDNKVFCAEIEKREKVCAEFAAENRRIRDDNKRLSLDRDAALEELDEAYARYRELRDRVEKIAHRVEEMTGEMIGSVHEL